MLHESVCSDLVETIIPGLRIKWTSGPLVIVYVIYMNNAVVNQLPSCPTIMHEASRTVRKFHTTTEDGAVLFLLQLT